MARKRTEWLQFGSGKSYIDRVHQPLQCFIFISPLLAFYQVASAIHPWNPSQQPTPLVEAFVLMLRFFNLFGVVGNYFPLLAVVAILISWHFARKDPWKIEPKLYLGMFGESLVWGLPMFIIGLAIAPQAAAAAAVSPPAMGGPSDLPLSSEIILSVGAGIYEELLFRLIAITLMNIILVDVFEMKLHTAIPIIIIASAVLFSAYHFLGPESFDMGRFLFRIGIGVYLAGIYIYRGFGIAVGAHTTYDVIRAVFLYTHQ